MFEPYIAKGKSTHGIAYDLLIADEVGRDWYDRSDVHDIREWVWCVKHVRPGMRVADCGAHHGALGVVLAKAVGPRGRVDSFEALPHNAEVVRRNFVLNHCENAASHAVALSDREGSIRLSAGDAGRTVYLGAGNDSIEVRAAMLDRELPDGADFLKIDVEGSEVEMLRGAERALGRRPIIDLELHNHLYSDRRRALEEIFGALTRLDYCFSWLPLAFEGEIQSLGWRPDLTRIAEVNNPHVFCLPVQVADARSSWRRRLRMFG